MKGTNHRNGGCHAETITEAGSATPARMRISSLRADSASATSMMLMPNRFVAW